MSMHETKGHGFRSLMRRLICCPPRCETRTWVFHLLVNKLFCKNPRVHWPVHVTTRVVCPERVKLGKASYPGDMPGCYIQAINGIEVGDDVLFGPGVGLISANHDIKTIYGHTAADPILIGSKCWFGMNAIVLPGVRLGDHTIVGAGAVVTKSFEEGYCVLAGNPATVVRKLDPADFKDDRFAE